MMFEWPYAALSKFSRCVGAVLVAIETFARIPRSGACIEWKESLLLTVFTEPRRRTVTRSTNVWCVMDKRLSQAVSGSCCLRLHPIRFLKVEGNCYLCPEHLLEIKLFSRFNLPRNDHTPPMSLKLWPSGRWPIKYSDEIAVHVIMISSPLPQLRFMPGGWLPLDAILEGILFLRAHYRPFDCTVALERSSAMCRLRG